MPVAPMAATQSDSEISITWSAVAGATHYNLYQATVSGGPYTQIEGDIDATGYLDSGLSVKTAYYYQLEACNGGVCSGRSPEVLASTYGSLGAARDEITIGLDIPRAIAFSGGRAYVVDADLDKIISYAVEADGSLGAGRDEITTGLSNPRAIAFSGGRAYVADYDFVNRVGYKSKIISYAVEADGSLGAERDEITNGLRNPHALAFSGGRAYVADSGPNKIISYPVGADGILGASRGEITTGLITPLALAFSGGRAYVVDLDFSSNEYKIISYPVGTGGILGTARDEVTTGLSYPIAIAFLGDRAYVADRDLEKIISYPVGAGGILGAARDEITDGLDIPRAIAFLGGRAYVANYDGSGNEYKIISYPLLSSVQFAVAPDAPRVFTQSDSEIEIAWNAVAGATHYKLYRSETSVGSFAQVEGDISVTRYRDSGLANTFYYYQLEACSGDECSERSPTAKAASAAPTAVAQSDSEILITWSAVAGATHYKLYWDFVSRGLFEFEQVGGEISATRYLHRGLLAGTAYYYRLEACNSNGCLGRSSEVSTVTYGSLGAARDEVTTGLPEPTALAFSGGRAYVTDASSDKIISYAVGADGILGTGREEATGLDEPAAIAFSGGRAYVADTFTGRIISYAVGADGNLGTARREEISRLDEPRALAFSGERIYVAESRDPGSISSYAVGAGGMLDRYRSVFSGSFDSEPTALAFSGGRAYVAKRGFFFADDNEDKIISHAVLASNRISTETRDEITTGLFNPRALAFSGGRAYVVDRFDIISYAVGANGKLGAARDERKDLDNPRALAFFGDRAYVADSGLDKIISYPLFQISTPVAPDAPVVVAQSDSEIEIAWNAVLGATHYYLDRAFTSSGNYTTIGGKISVTRYRHSGLSANTSYYYKLLACNGDKCSGHSPANSATTPRFFGGIIGSRGADDADDAAAKRQQDSDPIVSSSEACNGDECSQRSPEVLAATRLASKGVFHASGWVVGLDYQYGDGETGKTGEKGAFPLRSGQTVVFSTGQVTLGAVSIAADANADFFTPTRLGDQARAIRIERLLIALDSDGENDNGVVSLNAESASDALTAWNAARASDDEAATPINGRMRAIPSAATAATLLKRGQQLRLFGGFCRPMDGRRRQRRRTRDGVVGF